MPFSSIIKSPEVVCAFLSIVILTLFVSNKSLVITDCPSSGKLSIFCLSAEENKPLIVLVDNVGVIKYLFNS